MRESFKIIHNSNYFINILVEPNILLVYRDKNCMKDSSLELNETYRFQSPNTDGVFMIYKQGEHEFVPVLDFTRTSDLSEEEYFQQSIAYEGVIDFNTLVKFQEILKHQYFQHLYPMCIIGANHATCTSYFFNWSDKWKLFY